MKPIARVVSWAALACTLLPPVLYFAGRIDLPAAKLWMLVATVAWFAATPVWMEHDSTDAGES